MLSLQAVDEIRGQNSAAGQLLLQPSAGSWTTAIVNWP